jgi:hypothetical protein
MTEAGPFAADTERAESDPLLVVDVGGFEGPLDLLLDLARRQKVDLHEISVLALAEQYLAFVETARAMRLELAADYLVMAAWLAYLKSRLLLPEPPKPEGPSATELASALANRLRRLEAIRKAARLLSERPQLGRRNRGAQLHGLALRSSVDLRETAAAPGVEPRHGRQAALLVARRRQGGAGTPRRPGGGLDRARRVSAALHRRAGDAPDGPGVRTLGCA